MGISSEIPIAAPKPGRAPIIMPIKVPKKTRKIFNTDTEARNP
jgi:hypothetical protein